MNRTSYANPGRSADQLAQTFRNGGRPPRVPVGFVLEDGEFCAGEIPVVVLQQLEGDGVYVRKSGGYVIGGSPGGAVLGTVYSLARFTTNIVGNRARRARAAREAALQFRPVDSGTLFMTDRRFAIQGRQWTDLWYRDIRTSECDGHVIELNVSGSAPLRLQIPDAGYWFVMFNKLAYDRVQLPARGSTTASPVAQFTEARVSRARLWATAAAVLAILGIVFALSRPHSNVGAAPLPPTSAPTADFTVQPTDDPTEDPAVDESTPQQLSGPLLVDRTGRAFAKDDCLEPRKITSPLWLSNQTIVNCNEDHGWQVGATVDLTEHDWTYAEMLAQALGPGVKLCENNMTHFVEPGGTEIVAILAVSPDRKQWKAGVQEIVCLVGIKERSQVNSSRPPDTTTGYLAEG